MIEFVDYKETKIYTVEQVREVIENISRTLNINTTKVFFSENPSTVSLQVGDTESYKIIIDGQLSYDITSQQPKIVINQDNLEKTQFNQILTHAVQSAEERAGVIYVKRRVGFGTRLNTLLEFTEDDHTVITYLMAGKGMTHKSYKVSDIVDSDQLLFELICFKVFNDDMMPTADSVQDLIQNFDKHVALSDMKEI